MEFLGVQLMGLIFSTAMVYFTYLFFRKKHFNKNDFLLWMIVWIGLLVAVSFPETLKFFIESLGFIRAMDFLMITAFMVGFALLFFLYSTVRKNQKKLEEVVEKIALKKFQKK